MAKCKILQINGRSDRSGGPISMLGIIQNLNPDQYEHTVLCPFEKDGILSELENCANCTAHPMDFRSPKNFYNLFKLIKFIRRGEFDLIHSHGKAAGVYSRIAGKISNIPVIHHLHGIHYRQYTKTVQLLYQGVEAILSEWSRRIICVSESERQEGLSLGMFKDSQATVIQNGVNINVFKYSKNKKTELREKWNIPANAKVIISITRNCYQKNPELSLKIHANLCQKYPDLFLFLIGIPSDSSNIIKLAEKLGTKDRVFITDKQQNMNYLLNIGDLYLNCSRWEGLSIGIIEAMATNLPVVLSNVVGNEELIGNQENGVLFVKDNSINSYCEAIERLLGNNELASAWGAKARIAATEEFNLIDKIEMIEKEYQSVVEGPVLLANNKPLFKI